MEGGDIYLLKRVSSNPDDDNSLCEYIFEKASEVDIAKLDIARTLSIELSPRKERYLKEETEIEEVNYEDILKRIETLPIYFYEVDDRRYIGPLMVDWNECCMINPMKKILIGREIEGQLVSEEALAKEESNNKKIENVDVMGVCLASIRGLAKRISNINERLKKLEGTSQGE